MGKIYKNQDGLRLTFHLGINLSGLLSASIKYIKPNGEEGSWAATVSDSTNGIIYKDLVAGSPLGASGIWTFWGYVEFDDGREAPGNKITQMVHDEGS